MFFRPPINNILSTSKSTSNEEDDNESPSNYENFVLPALSVMNKLHQRPYGVWRLYNVELVGYDDCHDNLDLVVNREVMWRDALRVLMQAAFLPFFILFPPIWWLRVFKEICCTCGGLEIEPRYRPLGDFVRDFEVILFCVIQEPIQCL